MILYKLDPLELPEIFMRVGEFLCPLSLTRSLLVSRAWYQVLLPLVWSYEITPFSLDLHAWEQHEEDTQQQQQQRWGRRQEKSHELPQRQQPTRDAIRKHNLLIRNLVLAYDDAIHIGISTQDPKRNFSFPHLTTLRLFENTLVPSRVLQVEFIQQHRATLKDVVIGGTHVGELLDTLASCPCLERLTVFEPLVFEDQSAWLSQLKRLWFRLRVVELYGPWYEANDSSSSSSSSALSSPSVAGSTPITSTISVPLLVELPERASRIQDLSMRVSRGTRFEAQLGMIAQSPDLVKLAWTFDISKYMSEEEKEHLDRTAPVRNLVEMMTTNRSPQPCQRLQELALPYAAFRNEEFSTLLHSMRLPNEFSANVGLSDLSQLAGICDTRYDVLSANSGSAEG
ncbi:hypothetical protein BGZ83_007463 [Gryganskiella cystojenkinii]|nr:hypothetical protein BGZ83_007463 [Gryganskiella cystojenkinii]